MCGGACKGRGRERRRETIRGGKSHGKGFTGVRHGNGMAQVAGVEGTREGVEGGLSGSESGGE
jgi:hypothetical protein